MTSTGSAAEVNQDAIPTPLIVVSAIVTAGYIVGTIFLGISNADTFDKAYWPSLAGLLTLPFHAVTIGSALSCTANKAQGAWLQAKGYQMAKTAKEKVEKFTGINS